MHISKPDYSVQKPNAVALSSQEAQWVRLAIATNNIANANTPGFKSEMIKLVNATQKGKATRVVNYVCANKSLRNLANGSYRQTGNPLDVSLSGNGYFMVGTDKGKYLTRNGQFALDGKGELVTATGSYYVLDEGGGHIVIPPTTKQIIIESQGGVYADSVFVGRIGVFKVDDQQEKLKKLGNNLLDPTVQVPTISDKYYIKQFGLEDSNVSGVSESLVMIETLRHFEYAQQIIQEQDQKSKKEINVSPKNV